MTDLRLRARDGYPLAATAYTARRPMKRKVVIINTAAGAPRRAYDAFAAFIADAGYPVVTYDYRGTGGSRPESLRGFKAHLVDWAEQDFAGVVDWVHGAYPTFEKVLVGHRMGGVLAAIAPDMDRIAGMLAVGVASEYWKLSPFLRRFWLYARWHAFVPGNVAFLGYQPAWPFNLEFDLPGGVAWDRARLGRTEGHVLGEPRLDAANRAAKFRGPLLVAQLAGDTRASQQAADTILAAFANATVTRWDISTKGLPRRARKRLGFFKPSVFRQHWSHVVDWLESF